MIITFDTETTGLPPKGAKYDVQLKDWPRILSVAWKVDDKETKEIFVNSDGFKLPEEAMKVNGTTQEMADNAKIMLQDALDEMLCDFIRADKIIAHNIYFDTSIIKANARRLCAEGKLQKSFIYCFDVALHKSKRLDTMWVARGIIGGKWPKLTELYTHLFGETFDAHNAKDDVEACYRCYVELKKRGKIK